MASCRQQSKLQIDNVNALTGENVDNGIMLSLNIQQYDVYNKVWRVAWQQNVHNETALLFMSVSGLKEQLLYTSASHSRDI